MNFSKRKKKLYNLNSFFLAEGDESDGVDPVAVVNNTMEVATRSEKSTKMKGYVETLGVTEYSILLNFVNKCYTVITF